MKGFVWEQIHPHAYRLVFDDFVRRVEYPYYLEPTTPDSGRVFYDGISSNYRPKSPTLSEPEVGSCDVCGEYCASCEANLDRWRDRQLALDLECENEVVVHFLSLGCPSIPEIDDVFHVSLEGLLMIHFGEAA